MEDGIEAKEGYKPLIVKYGLQNIRKDTYKPPTS